MACRQGCIGSMLQALSGACLHMCMSMLQGFMWLHGRRSMCGSWSQAGGILRLGPGGPWFAAVPDDAWPEDKEARESILKASHTSPAICQLVSYCGSKHAHIGTSALMTRLPCNLYTDRHRQTRPLHVLC